MWRMVLEHSVAPVQYLADRPDVCMTLLFPAAQSVTH